MLSFLGNQVVINFCAVIANLFFSMKNSFSKIATIAGIVAVTMTHIATAADAVGNAKAAKNKVAMCVGCHGIPFYKATFPEVYRVPKLGGQSAKYLENALHAYKKGERTHPTMDGIAKGLSDQDIADLAAYYAQQSEQQNAQQK